MFTTREEFKALLKECIREVLAESSISQGQDIPPVMTVEQASKVLSLPMDTVYDHLNAGVIRGTKRGKRWFISREAVQDFIAGRVTPVITKFSPRKKAL
jgi:excisionase family DNA binding protein